MVVIGTNSYRILIADDQHMTREGLKLILESQGDFKVVGMASNGLEAYEQTKALMPDLVIMDVRMPIMDGISSLKRIKSELPLMIVIILTTFVEDEYIIDGLANGASGYLLKDMESERLVASIRDAAAGQFVLQGVIAEKMAIRLQAVQHVASTIEATVHQGMPKLTEREEEVARLLMKGAENGDISRFLQISDGTVRNYISVIYGKLGVNSRMKAVLLLRQIYEV